MRSRVGDVSFIAMSQSVIVRKLASELDKGITTEVQVVYLMAAVRKLLEQQDPRTRDQKPQRPYLWFHCDWCLHSRLFKSKKAQDILEKFDRAHVCLMEQIESGRSIEPKGLTPEIQKEVQQISGMELFDKELNEFLEANGLPSLRSGGNWVGFVQLYSRVVEDCPLVMRSNNESANIVQVTLHVEQRPDVFAVCWKVEDKDGKSGEFSVAFGSSAVPRPNLLLS